MRKTVFENIYLELINENRVNGRPTKLVKFENILKLISMMQNYELDCHVVIAGQNGVGKSYLLMILLKSVLGDKFLNNMIWAKDTSTDIIDKILVNRKTVFGIDELNYYLNYKEHASIEQNHFIKSLETAREKAIGFIGCVRDPRKLTYNYRNGKMSIVIWVLDRFTDGGAYCAVFIANPVIESSDSFGFDFLNFNITNFDELKVIIEEIPSFNGYMVVPKIDKYLTPNEIKSYKEIKDISMAYSQLNHFISLLLKRKINKSEFDYKTQNLINILGLENYTEAVNKIKVNK